jgi:hypothetical protein
MGAACFKAVGDNDAVSATSTDSKPHPELTWSSPDAKRASAACTFHTAHSPKSLGSKSPGSRGGLQDPRPKSDSPEFVIQHDAEQVLVADDSILSCTCSDVIASPPVGPEKLEPPSASASSCNPPPQGHTLNDAVACPQQHDNGCIVALDTSDTFTVHSEAEQLQPHAKAKYEEFVMQYAEPEERMLSLAQKCVNLPDDDQLTGVTLEDVDSRVNGISSEPESKGSKDLAQETAAVAQFYGHGGDGYEAISGILGVRDPSLLESPFADSAGASADLVEGAAFDKVFEGPSEGNNQLGDSVQLDMSLFNSAKDSATPRFSCAVAQRQPDTHFVRLQLGCVPDTVLHLMIPETFCIYLFVYFLHAA